MHCVPTDDHGQMVEDYAAFLEARRGLMSEKLRLYFEGL